MCTRRRRAGSRPSYPGWRIAFLLLGLTLGGGNAPSSAAAAIHVALVPETAQVAPGAEFRVRVVAVESGSAFNGYDAVVTYDPAALTFLPMAPVSLQEGSLMTGACGLRFHNFSPSAGTLTISHVLLCSGVTVTGPGELYVLRFRASEEPQFTDVRFVPAPKFYDAGVLVQPTVAEDATIQIGVPTDVHPGPLPALPRLEAFPNPSGSRFAFRVAGAAESRQSLTIRDIRGRAIRTFTLEPSDASERRIEWDGTFERGGAVPSGVYQAELRTQRGTVSTRIVLVRR